jgi:uncharacterized protein (TIGR02217 family)
MPSFHDVLFPPEISYGSSGGPGFHTTINTLDNGFEQRSINWKDAKAKYDVSHGIKSREQMEELLDFFYARNGRAYGFLFKDWADYQIDRQLVAYTTGSANQTVQLFKRYDRFSTFAYDRTIHKIVPGSLKVWINGLPAGSITAYNDTGKFKINSAPVADKMIEVECQFYVPVRFDTDEMNIVHDSWETMSWPSIPLVELKLRETL